MSRFVGKFLTTTRVGRWLLPVVHRRLHPGIRHPFRFQGGACWLCNVVMEEAARHFPDDFADQSTIKISEPSEGRLGISMSATAKRQLDAIKENDPEAWALIQRQMEEIAKNPEP